MVGTTVTRCIVPGCAFKTFSEQPGMALAKHHQQSHLAAVQRGVADPRIAQNRGLHEMLRVVTIERDALREHLEKFHICSVRCSGEKRP